MNKRRCKTRDHRDWAADFRAEIIAQLLAEVTGGQCLLA